MKNVKNQNSIFFSDLISSKEATAANKKEAKAPAILEAWKISNKNNNVQTINKLLIKTII